MANADRTGGWTAPSGLYNAAVDMVDRNVEEGRGDKLAFMDPKRLLTYAELQAACNRMANVLPRLGIGRERRIAMIMLDDVDFPVVFWGAIKAGVVPVPLNTLLPPEAWRYMIEDSRADAVVISAGLLARARPMLEEIAARRHLHVIVPGGEDDDLTLGFERLMERSEPSAEAADTNADEVAFWLYSSGSTGTPKGTRHLHASPMATARLFGKGVLGITSDDVIFSAAKLFFAYGLGNAMSFPMSVGADRLPAAGPPHARQRHGGHACRQSDHLLRRADALRRDAGERRHRQRRRLEPAAAVRLGRRGAARADRHRLAEGGWRRGDRRHRLH